MDNENMTLDAAMAWIEKAQQLGYYNTNTARLIKAGAEAVSRVLVADDDRSIDQIANSLDGIYTRLVNRREGAISGATAATYVARTKRLLNDYNGWKNNPRGFKPTSKRGRGPGRAKPAAPTPPAATMSLFPDAVPQAPVGAAGPGYQEHALSLPSGKAYLRIPATISQDDFNLLTAVLKLHVSQGTGT